MEEITPTYIAFGNVTKALKSEGYIPVSPLKRSDYFIALDDAEIAECLEDSLEFQCSHASSPHNILHVHNIEKEVRHKVSLEPKYNLSPVSLSEVQMLIKSLKTGKSLGLDGISNKAS
ncbi:hypothetical protein EVAR_44231_1 [Eumeta japonica]|uniref:Uncharacterized protein n=1 Tax=Eumeta variegata TaxID=151549 RepID=A0A4C1XA30_EUMVA|nr:hypothetical protein EVAR_44231_1 [Eumeta japonica]